MRTSPWTLGEQASSLSISFASKSTEITFDEARAEVHMPLMIARARSPLFPKL